MKLSWKFEKNKRDEMYLTLTLTLFLALKLYSKVLPTTAYLFRFQAVLLGLIVSASCQFLVVDLVHQIKLERLPQSVSF